MITVHCYWAGRRRDPIPVRINPRYIIRYSPTPDPVAPERTEIILSEKSVYPGGNRRIEVAEYATEIDEKIKSAE